jgi:hypothetical protein
MQPWGNCYHGVKKGAINSLGSKFYNLFNYEQGGSKFILRMY